MPKMKMRARTGEQWLGTALFLALLSLAAAAQTQTDDGPIHVCVGPDKVLRRRDLRASCPTGQTSLYLARDQPNFEDTSNPPTDKPNPEPQPAGTPPSNLPAPVPMPTLVTVRTPRVQTLETRVANFEGRPRSRATAPFEVVDRNGRPILRVEPDFVRLYHDGQPEAGFSVSRYGANIVLGKELRTQLFSFGKQAGFTIDQGEKTVVDLGTGDNGNYRLVFLSSDGNAIAGIGQSAAGTAAVRIGSHDGKMRAAMQIDSRNNGMVTVFGDTENPVASLTHGENPGGLLEIGDAGSQPLVKAGVALGGRYGVVLTGPAAIFPANGMGLPGSYLLGSAK